MIGTRTVLARAGVVCMFVLATAAGWWAIGDPAAKAGFPGRSGQIFFTQAECGTECPDEPPSVQDHEIYALRLGDGSVTQLTHNSRNEGELAVSPDGRYLLFVRDDGNLYRINVDGTDEELLTTATHEVIDPTWSPDGTKIAFWSRFGPDSNPRITIMNADGTMHRVLGPINVAAFHYLRWSPNGRRFVFRSEDEEIYTVGNGGRGLRHLTTGSVPRCNVPSAPSSCRLKGTAPDWSPNGRFIVFSAETNVSCEGPRTLMRMRANGSDRRLHKCDERWGTSAIEHMYPEWSPNGRFIAYVGRDDMWECHGLDELRIETLKGGARRTVYSVCDDARMGDVEWQPLCTVPGTDGDDVLRGTRGRDVICGGGGDDIIRGLRGHDVIFGGEGNDIVRAGRGRDMVNGGPGDDVLNGQGGTDRIVDIAGSDELIGGRKSDRLDALDGEGDDLLRGAWGRDTCRKDTLDRRRSCRLVN